MPKAWYRGVPASGLALLLVIPLCLWRAESASTLERVWIGMMTFATAFGLWGLARATQTRAWVNDERARHPRQDWRSAELTAQIHLIVHACTLATTVILLGFGVIAAFTLPANPGQPPTRVGYALTVALILVGVIKTALNVYLVVARDRLVATVQAIGGD